MAIPRIILCRKLVVFLTIIGIVLVENTAAGIDCNETLGMENGAIVDEQITASSQWDGYHAPEQGRLHFPEAGGKAGGWAARARDTNQWLQIDLKNSYTNITRVATQGRNGANEWVTKYNLLYSDDAANFSFYVEQGGIKANEFAANTDRNTIVYHELHPPIIARYVRFRPLTWFAHITMRAELYGCLLDEDECQSGTHNCSLNAQCINTFGSFVCTCLRGYSGDGVECSDLDECQTGTHDCHVHSRCVNIIGSYNCTCLPGYSGDGLECYECYEALGMENGAIADEQISASSQWDGYHAAVQGRLHFPEAGGKAGGWAARTRDSNQWLQVDLKNEYTNITRVATQGRNGANEWVTKYNLLYSDDGANFSFYAEQGQIIAKEFAANTDRNTIVYHELHPPIMARYIRFRPLTWFVHITMRAELYGCLLDEDECQSGTHNCSLNAQCMNTFGSFVCTCLHGYSGDGIECSDLDECQTGTHDCHVHSRCVNIIGSYNCTCLPGYSGDGLKCYECYEALGMENGAIADEQISASSEWDGYHAAVQGRLHFPEADGKAGGWAARSRDTDQWLQIDLKNKGTNFTRVATQGRNGANEWVTEYALQYSDDGVDFYYYLDQGQIIRKVFSGNTDRNTIIYHDLNPPIKARYIRFRPVAWFTHITMRVELYGCLLDEDEDEDECQKETHNCDVNAQCNNTIGSFNCACLQGYLGDGVQCSDEDECRNGTHNCAVNAKCHNTIGSFNCTCNPGFLGDGVQCSDQDECQNGTHNCDVNAECNNTIGSFTCVCLPGHLGDGVQCTDEDECQTGSHDCAVNAQCNNTFGSFNCTCLQGYFGDGIQCSDEDECQNGIHNCDVYAYCSNALGSFNCTCLQGYLGDGVQCYDEDECQDGTHNCNANAQCNNTFGSFICTCIKGYSGDGVACYDEDECQNGTHNCHMNAQCSNTNGSFQCTCLQGYTGDGERCSDIDECTIATHNCHGVAHCYNNDGSFICECRKGYTGDGLLCESMGDFSVTLGNISKNNYRATSVARSTKRILDATIEPLPEDVSVLESVVQWRLLSDIELASSELAEGTLVGHGTNEWTIHRRSIPAGIYQVKFTVSLTTRKSGFLRNVNGFDYGFFQIVSAPIRVIIDGGSSVRWGSKENVTVDGSLTYDRDVGPEDLTGLDFTWSCHDSEANTSLTNKCFHSFVVQANVTSSANIDTSRLEIGVVYVMRLTVSKNERSSFTEMSFEIVDGKIPHIALRCFADCGTTISPSNKFRVSSQCTNTACVGAVYQWRLRKWNDREKLWENVPLSSYMIPTDANATSIVFNKNSLPTSSKFCLILFVTPQQGKENFALLHFYTDGEPHGGYCNQSVIEGTSLETKFSFECFGWKDKNNPISYEFRLGNEPISYGFASKSVSTVLPAGYQEDDYHQQINIVIKNSASVEVVETLDIKVKPYSRLDPCTSPAKEISKELQNLVLGDESTLDVFLRRGEVKKASQLALSVLKAINISQSDCGEALNQGLKMLVLRKLIETFTYITPESMQMSRMIMAVVNKAIEDQQGQSCESSENTVLSNLFQDLAMKPIDETTNLLLSAVEDVEEPFSSNLEETAASVTRCIKNVIWSASCTIQGNRASEKIIASSKEVLRGVLEKLNTLSGAFFSRLVSSETLVIKVPDLEFFLKKVAVDDLKGIIIDRESTRFKLPENFAISEEGNINLKMIAIKFNPFIWDKSSELVQSSIISLELQRGDTETIAVADLDSDIEIIVPLNRVPVNTSDPTEHSFLKPRKISSHKYHSEIPGLPVSLKLGTQAKDITIEIFVKFGLKPTMEEFDYNFVVQFNSTRESQTNVENIDKSSLQETSVTLMPSDESLLYVSLLFLGARNVSEHSRKRRSCFGHGRERRSCVGVKNPPPKGISKTFIPQYDPLTDVNYTLTITQSSCLYWSEDVEKWTSYGCKVDPRSNSTHLMCLCNHLTFFGGNFIQAPNPIDFDKVVTELARIDESGNISVLVTVAILFLLYIVVLIFARRADRRDAIKICPPRHVTIGEGGSYLYDLVITTGVWRNSGTTASVTISINGKMNEHNLIQLRGKGDSREIFSRGSIDGFVLVTKESLGPLNDITLEHDNSGENPSWFVETTTIRDRQTDEKWVFPMNRWLALDKADGEIEVTSENTSHISFSNKLHLLFGRKLVDSHLWLSVFCKPCSSTFSRVQRASCCLSLLFSAMIASVMFYNIRGESDGTIQVGPFKFSWRQILIGVQSGLIVAPINILIVFLFKYGGPRRHGLYKVKEGDQIQHLADKLRKPACILPHVFVYVGWFLCLATALTAAFFTILYTLLWGKKVSEQWLASTLIAFSQDILVVQPTKAMVAVILIALLLTRNKDHQSELTGERDDSSGINIDFLRDDPKRRLKLYKLEALRERTNKEAQLTNMVKKIVLHLVFLFLLAVVCYGNKNENRYLMTTEMRNPTLTKTFSKVKGYRSLWGWLRQKLMPTIYNRSWYNGFEEKNEMYIGNKISILIGMLWMRQLRVKKSSCENDYHNISDCYYDYSSKVEDNTLLSLPYWKPLTHNISWSEALKICPKPWRYHTAEELNQGPIRGSYNTYEGGGYPAVLGYNTDTAGRVLNETLGLQWVDRQTRAVILEFTVFNANTNLISIATYFYEVLATGAAYTTSRIETLELYSTESGARMFYLICQFLFLIMVLYCFIKMLIRIYRLRFGFFKQVWNMVDFLMIIFSIASVAAYMMRSKSILNSIKSIQNNPYEIAHFQSALDWTSWEDASVAVAIFMATLKLLNLIRFNPHVIFLFLSFRQSLGYQISYAVFFLIIFNAFVFSGIQFFGNTVHFYSSYIQAVVGQLEFLLGKAFPLDDLRNENPFVGPVFAISYMLITTILFMNMIVSVLNEAYAKARMHAEENVDELEVARFIGQRLENIFGARGRTKIEMKLFCDDSVHLNMCVSDAEPFCLNSQSISLCTEERIARLEKRLAAFSRLTKNLEVDLVEDTLFLDGLYSIIRPGCQITRL